MASFSQAMPAFSQRNFATAAALGASFLPLDFGFQNCNETNVSYASPLAFRCRLKGHPARNTRKGIGAKPSRVPLKGLGEAAEKAEAGVLLSSQPGMKAVVFQ